MRYESNTEEWNLCRKTPYPFHHSLQTKLSPAHLEGMGHYLAQVVSSTE